MTLRIVVATSFPLVFAMSATQAKQAPLGSWAQGYNHPASTSGWPSTFEAINLAVIPLLGTGGPSNPGQVIAWDRNSANTVLGTGVPWPQRFTVGAPETGVFSNYIISIPAGFGDIFCSGHVWMPDGKLFVAGGTTQYPTTGSNFYIGSRFVGIWDPAQANSVPDHGWTFVCDPAGQNKPLQIERWYPTVTLLGNDQIMVSGGDVDTNPIHNQCGTWTTFDNAIDTYEVWDIALNDWIRDPVTGLNIIYPGPEHALPYFGTCFSMFGEYPRQLLLSFGDLFLVGMFRGSNHVHPTAHGTWKQDPPPLSNRVDTGERRSYGASVLLPNIGNRPGGRDRVFIIGGSDGVNTTDSVQTINGFGGTAWTAAPSMNVGRMVANTVLLPDGAILEIGGCTGSDYWTNNPPTPMPERRPEIYRKTMNAWVLQAPQVSERMYHSTAALLPSGNVVSAGSDIRTWDWEVFTPDYLSNGQTRPSLTVPPPATLSFNTNYTFQYSPMPGGLFVDRVVLMRPCSITHHSDMDQRYVELMEATPTPPPLTITITTPPTPNPTGTTQGSVVTPSGWYMLFLISNTGTPSIGEWVQLQ